MDKLILCKYLDVYFYENHLPVYTAAKENPLCTQRLSYELASSVANPPELYRNRKTTCILVWLN
jgi:hypothetical protein